MADLSRNANVAIYSQTSSQQAWLGVADLLTARAGPIRALSGGTTLNSATTSVQFPYEYDDKIAFIVSWCATAEGATTGSLQVQVKAGDGWKASQGNYTFYVDTGVTGSNSTAGRLKRWIVGPFESARFTEEATSTAGGASTGDMALTFKLTTASLAMSTRARGAVNILPFKLPVVDYAT